MNSKFTNSKEEYSVVLEYAYKEKGKWAFKTKTHHDGIYSIVSNTLVFFTIAINTNTVYC